LKQFFLLLYIGDIDGFREKSTKTRIETGNPKSPLLVQDQVLEKNPPKQGLKPSSQTRIHRQGTNWF